MHICLSLQCKIERGVTYMNESCSTYVSVYERVMLRIRLSLQIESVLCNIESNGQCCARKRGMSPLSTSLSLQIESVLCNIDSHVAPMSRSPSLVQDREGCHVYERVMLRIRLSLQIESVLCKMESHVAPMSLSPSLV